MATWEIVPKGTDSNFESDFAETVTHIRSRLDIAEDDWDRVYLPAMSDRLFDNNEDFARRCAAYEREHEYED